MQALSRSVALILVGCLLCESLPAGDFTSSAKGIFPSCETQNQALIQAAYWASRRILPRISWGNRQAANQLAQPTHVTPAPPAGSYRAKIGELHGRSEGVRTRRARFLAEATGAEVRDVITRVMDGELQVVNAELEALVDAEHAIIKEAVNQPLEDFQRVLNGLRRLLMDPQEMTVDDFLAPEGDVAESIHNLPLGEQLEIGFQGGGASGKSTAAQQAHRIYTAELDDSYEIRALFGDDFLKEKADRADPNTQDPDVKFDIPGYVGFMADVKAKRRAKKPLYDQGAKGQARFSRDASGNILFYLGDVDAPGAVAGNRTVTITLNPDGKSFRYTERMKRDAREKNDAEGAAKLAPYIVDQERWIEDLTRRRNPSGELAREEFDCGEMHVQLSRDPESGLLTMILRDGIRFQFRGHPDGRVEYLVPGEDPQWLEPGQKVQALEIWEPVAPNKRRVIFGDFILLLRSPDWSYTAMASVKFGIRLLRSIIREVRRGRSLKEIADAIRMRVALERTEDLTINRLHSQAKGSPTHFEVNNMSLAELLLDRIRHGVVRVLNHGINFQFRLLGLGIRDLIDGHRRTGEVALIEWLGEIRAALGPDGYFQRPVFLGEKDLKLPEERQRYWTGFFRTFGVGNLLVKFGVDDRSESDPQITRGYLEPAKVAGLAALFARAKDLFVDAQVLDLTGTAVGRDFPIEILLPDGNKKYPKIQLGHVLVTNLVPYVEGRLKKIGEQHGKLLQQGKAAEAENVLSEGRAIIDEFFALQRQFWRRGIIDKAPHLPYRYGEGIVDGLGKIQCVAPSSLLVNDDADSALKEMQRLADAQDQQPYDPEKYKEYPAYADLKGFQRQFVRNLNDDDQIKYDFFDLIPDSLKNYFAESIRHTVPEDAEGMRRGRGFESEWKEAIAQGTQEKFRMHGVTVFEAEAARLHSIEKEVSLKFHLPRLYHYFERHFAEVVPATDEPLRAWVGLFLRSLTRDRSSTLYRLAERLYKQVLRNPEWLDQLRSRSATPAEAVNLTMQEVQKLLQEELNEAGQTLPTLLDWEASFIEQFLFYALQRVPASWQHIQPRNGTRTAA